MTQPQNIQTIIPCDCGSTEAYWHGDRSGHREYCCDECWNYPTVGETYVLNHSRFGKATVSVKRVDDTWADCVVLYGQLVGMMDEWHIGDEKTVRIKHGVWTRVI